ncbi:hypothetical protein HCZ23_17000 [Celeribacter sp. HF31]|uniref:hypothetical protein n=1 Tax=Celeribacter sp. HF31 TaxID=2721558 RepID=UPI0014300DA0|nr:hypothetical protein [Celeribacter sp. HF31]NIY81162.1 hypothetical protein [Celeribacter sp. HF31]
MNILPNLHADAASPPQELRTAGPTHRRLSKSCHIYFGCQKNNLAFAQKMGENESQYGVQPDQFPNILCCTAAFN